MKKLTALIFTAFLAGCGEREQLVSARSESAPDTLGKPDKEHQTETMRLFLPSLEYAVKVHENSKSHLLASRAIYRIVDEIPTDASIGFHEKEQEMILRRDELAHKLEDLQNRFPNPDIWLEIRKQISEFDSDAGAARDSWITAIKLRALDAGTDEEVDVAHRKYQDACGRPIFASGATE
jgi:hypothetical protein